MNLLGRRRGIAADRLRPSEEATFRNARLHLTAWYVLTLAVIVVLFSLALYAALSAQLSEHQRGEPERQPERQVEQDTTDFALSRLRLLLLGGNLLLLAGGAVGAYLLAGKTLQPIAAALDRQRRFTADASHELRTPLTVMRGEVDVELQRKRTAAEYRGVLVELGKEVDAMTELVEQLLRLARGRSRPPAAALRCDVRSALEDVVRRTAQLATRHGSTVSLALPGPLVARADQGDVRHVLLNLVTNALQHTPPGTLVQLTAEPHNGAIDLVVSDDGPGIPSDERTSVFEPFYRLHTTGSDGAGLGLALCRELVWANGGSIALEETAGGGATFQVRLPAAHQ
jgi:signal transduction histidine kinase